MHLEIYAVWKRALRPRFAQYEDLPGRAKAPGPGLNRQLGWIPQLSTSHGQRALLFQQLRFPFDDRRHRVPNADQVDAQDRYAQCSNQGKRQQRKQFASVS